MNLGENIHRLRIEKCLSQSGLADALEVSRQSVSKWENGSAVPDLEKLIKMSRLFGVTLDDLVGGSESVNAPPSPQKEPKPPVISNVFILSGRQISVKKAVGLVLLAVGLLFLPLALAAETRPAAEICFLLCAILAICGLCFLTMEFPYVSCGWVALAAYSAYFFGFTPWERAYLPLAAIFFALAGLICWTAMAQRRGLIRVPRAVWIFGGIVLALLFLLFAVNFFPPIGVNSASNSVLGPSG